MEGQGSCLALLPDTVGRCLWVLTHLPSGGEGQRAWLVHAEVVKMDVAAKGKMGQKGSRVKVGSRVKSRELNSSLAEGYARGSC